MEALRDIGLTYVLVGIESFKDDELRGLNKKVTSQTNVEAVRLLKKTGIRISPHMIVNPEFTRRISGISTDAWSRWSSSSPFSRS